MIYAWLGKSFLGLTRGWWILIAIGALGLAYAALNLWIDKTIDTAKDAGATEQREGDLRETLNRTEQGNEARNEIRDDVGTARYDQCLRTARTPANCERFLPKLQAPVR